jgi:hypothetical protein
MHGQIQSPPDSAALFPPADERRRIEALLAQALDAARQ